MLLNLNRIFIYYLMLLPAFKVRVPRLVMTSAPSH